MFDIMGHMTRPIGEYDEAMRLLSDGFAQAEVARMPEFPGRLSGRGSREALAGHRPAPRRAQKSLVPTS